MKLEIAEKLVNGISKRYIPKIKGIEEINIDLRPVFSKEEGTTEYYATVQYIFNNDFEHGTTTKIDEFKYKFTDKMVSDINSVLDGVVHIIPNQIGLTHKNYK
jgi:hypothetical protein